MKQTVHNVFFNQNLLSKTGFDFPSEQSGLNQKRRVLLTFLTTLLTVACMAQTHTTKGGWNSASAVIFGALSITTQNSDAVIAWEVANSNDYNYFVVQRSTDGKSFSNIATVFAGAVTDYAYRDKRIKSSTGVAYYRVVSMNETKETKSTATKMIRLNDDGQLQTLSINTFPNPAANDLRITLPATWQGKTVTLEVYASEGTILKRTKTENAGQTENLQLNGLTKGLYFVKATCGAENAMQRIAKN